LQSGNLTAAQQSYTTLAQDLESFGQSTAQTSSQASFSSGSLSLSA